MLDYMKETHGGLNSDMFVLLIKPHYQSHVATLGLKEFCPIFHFLGCSSSHLKQSSTPILLNFVKISHIIIEGNKGTKGNKSCSCITVVNEGCMTWGGNGVFMWLVTITCKYNSIL